MELRCNYTTAPNNLDPVDYSPESQDYDHLVSHQS